MSLIDKWNKLAKKKIYINGTLEIGVGRLIFMIILTSFEVIGMLLTGAPLASTFYAWSNLIVALKKPTKEEKKDQTPL
ncbi:hypothetical protein LCGC14_1682900 [marine sediment metagenome]|uniref:Uncharacterized protein n=1 Tax=marine sediment metagenome TaxID=412755 RepID=A0A0F9HNJ5_9ZZZZ